MMAFFALVKVSLQIREHGPYPTLLYSLLLNYIFLWEAARVILQHFRFLNFRILAINALYTQRPKQAYLYQLNNCFLFDILPGYNKNTLGHYSML